MLNITLNFENDTENEQFFIFIRDLKKEPRG